MGPELKTIWCSLKYCGSDSPRNKENPSMNLVLKLFRLQNCRNPRPAEPALNTDKWSPMLLPQQDFLLHVYMLNEAKALEISPVGSQDERDQVQLRDKNVLFFRGNTRIINIDQLTTNLPGGISPHAYESSNDLKTRSNNEGTLNGPHDQEETINFLIESGQKTRPEILSFVDKYLRLLKFSTQIWRNGRRYGTSIERARESVGGDREIAGVGELDGHLAADPLAWAVERRQAVEPAAFRLPHHFLVGGVG
nr:hypothetical protein Iba_chr15aCG4520 [Ipomoea batatas]